MKKRVLSLFLSLAVCLGLTAPAFGAKIDVSDMPGHEVLGQIPDTLQHPAQPTTLEQINEIRYTRGTAWDAEKSEETVFQNLMDLADRLTSGKSSDTQKMKAIFDWVVENTKYDYEAYQYYIKRRNGEALTQAETDCLNHSADPFYAYINGKAICEGYSRLCWLMGTFAGIPVAFISGGASGGAHGWNAALVDGQWLFFDATWGMWDMEPDYHTSSSTAEYFDGVFYMEGYVYDGSPVLHMRLRKGFEAPAKVTVPSLVTDVSIPNSTTLTEVIIPEGVTSVYFLGCTNLTRVTLPNSLTVISDGAFSATGLTSIEIPRGTTKIGHSAFSKCTRLTSVTIPANVTTLGEQSFSDCAGLETVTIARASVGTSAFYECTNLKNVTLGSGVPSIGDLAFMSCTGLKNITIPGSVASIGIQAFYECTNLETVTFGNGLKTIGKLAFFGCTNLKKADLPDSITNIDSSAFSECPNLPKRTTIPAGVTEIEAYAFRGNTELTSMVIPDHITKIGYQSFMDCTNLQSVTIPDSVTTIDLWAFASCSGLTSVTLPKGITSIEAYVFDYCSSLKSIAIPSSVTSIGDCAFRMCKALSDITLPAGVTSIGKNAFSGCVSLTALAIPDSVTSIGAYAFYNCTGLESITIPQGVDDIGEFTFDHCTGLKYVTIPSSVTSIGDWAFEDCTSLKDIYYTGTEAQWKAISIGRDNEALTSAAIHYNSTAPVSQTPAALAYASTQAVLVDGAAVEFEMYALKDSEGSDTNYIKLRDLAYVLNGTAVQFEVEWTGAINIKPGQSYTANGSEMSTPYSGNRAYEKSAAVTNVGGTPAALDAIMLKDDLGGAYTYYKLRDLGGAIGFTVDWSADKGVYIETK